MIAGSDTGSDRGTTLVMRRAGGRRGGAFVTAGRGVTMCRWIAYTGTPVLLSRVLFQPEHSLIDQSLHSRMGVETTNGDGFGVGWYPQDTDDPTPAVLRDVGPAWNNRNLQEVAHHTRSGLFFGHIRASTGTAVQQSNCHPFRHGRWLWMHNGMISEFHAAPA